MARALSPKELADKMAKWEAAGFDLATVQAMKISLQPDAQESKGRIHSRTGRLAKTVRVINPSSTVAKRRGAVIGGISAGSRSKSNPVEYAGIIQRGGRTRGAIIRPKSARALAFQGRTDIVVTTEVRHPGATIKAQEYLRVNEGRLGTTLDQSYQRSIDKDIG